MIFNAANFTGNVTQTCNISIIKEITRNFQKTCKTKFCSNFVLFRIFAIFDILKHRGHIALPSYQLSKVYLLLSESKFFILPFILLLISYTLQFYTLFSIERCIKHSEPQRVKFSLITSPEISIYVII